MTFTCYNWGNRHNEFAALLQTIPSIKYWIKISYYIFKSILYSKKVIHWLKFIEARRKKEKEGMGDIEKDHTGSQGKLLGVRGEKWEINETWLVKCWLLLNIKKSFHLFLHYTICSLPIFLFIAKINNNHWVNCSNLTVGDLCNYSKKRGRYKHECIYLLEGQMNE